MRLSYKLLSTLLIALFSLNIGNAAIFTAVASGDWSAAATWGGTAPGNIIENGDQVIIPVGITVDLDMDVVVNDPASSIQVGGTLNATTGYGLAIVNGSLSGAGTIDIGALGLGSGGTLLFAGNLGANTLILNGQNLGLSLTATVDDTLRITNGALSVQGTGALNLGTGVVIELDDGSLVDAGGTINAAGDAHLVYKGSSDTTSAELTFASISTVTVELDNGSQSIMLSGNLTISDALRLEEGILDVNNKTLTLNGDFVTGTNGSLSFDNTGNLAIDGSSSLSSALAFEGGKTTLNDFTLNISGGGEAQLASVLTVEGTLDVANGTLNLQDQHLIMKGDFTAGAGGMLAGSNQADITINTSGSLSDALSFQSGAETVGNLTINFSSGGQAQLGSNLSVDGTLHMVDGILDIQDNELTIAGNFSAGANGHLAADDQASITINATGSLNDAISFSGGADTLNNLTLYIAGAGSAQIASDLTIDGMLDVQHGTLDIQNNSLTIHGDYTAGASGKLAVGNQADISIQSNGSLSSAIAFDASSNTLDNLTVDLGSTGEVQLGSDVTVQGTLDLTNSILNLQDNHLVLNGDFSAGSGGTLSFGDQAELTITTAGSLTSALAFAGGSDSLENLTVNISGGGSAQIGSNATVHGTLNLMNGTLDMQGNDLTIGGDFMAGAGGMLAFDDQGSLSIQSTGSLSNAIAFSGGAETLNNLTVDISGGQAEIASDITVDGMLNIQSGTLDIQDNSLTINGDYTAGASGQLAVGNQADISIQSNGSLSSAIAFDASSNTLDNLTVDLGSTGEVQLGSDATIQGTLNLMNGTLDLQDNHLTLSGDYMAGLGGNLSFGDQASLTINAAGSLTHGITLQGGTDTLDNLTINIGSGGEAEINSDVHVQGTLSLTSGTLNIQDQTLALYGNLQATLQGEVEANDQSNLWIMTTGTTSGTLMFDNSGNSLNDLIVNHSSGSVDFGSDVMVHGMLDLTSGNISVGSNDITVMSGATIQGGGPDSYVHADGSGTLMVNLSAGNSSTYPVGNASGYAGAQLVLNSGSGTGNYSIRVMDNVYAQGTTGADLSATEAVVDQTWLIETDAAGGVNLDLTLDWEAGAEVNGFDNQNAYISHYASAQWDSVASGSASSNANGTFSLTRSGITSLSPFAVFGESSAATTFTAVTSGDWSAAATWGGTSPGGLIDAGDDVVIPIGIDVNLDMDVVVNDANSSLSVAGTLSSNTTNSFTVANGSISGAGTIDIHRLNLESNASLLFAGSLSVSTLMIEGQQLAIALITTVHDSLIVKSGSLLLQATGVINFDDGVVLSFDGGSLIDAGGSLSLSGDANIGYSGSTSSTGAELGLSSISSVTVDLNSASDDVELSGDLHVTDMLTIQTGTLNTGNNSLIIGGDFWASANGSLSMGDQANLTISSDASLTGAIWFKGGSDTLNNLTINIGNDGQAKFESDVHVMGELYLAAGTMAIHNQTLALYGEFRAFAQGHLATNSQTNLWLMTTGTISGSLNLSDTANSVNNLVVDMTNDSIELGGDVLIHGTLTLDNGNVANGDFDVMLSESASVQGGGLNSYIQTSGNGTVMAELSAGDNMMYHVGTAEAYAGAMIELNSGSSGGNYGVAVMNDVYAQGTAGSDLSISQPLVDKTWLIDTDATGSVDVNLALTWEGASEVNAFDNQNAYISHYTGAQWDAVATASATANANGTYTITRNSVTSLSPFAVFDENTVVGIEDAEPLVELTIYPNPANEVLHVDQPNPQCLKAQVIGADGRVYYEFDLEAGTNAIDITRLENGHYFIRLEGNRGVYGFVKQ